MRVALLLLALVASSCALRGRLHVFPQCADGLPPEILIDIACPPDGVCGYSCLPGRWERTTQESCEARADLRRFLFGNLQHPDKVPVISRSA